MNKIKILHLITRSAFGGSQDNTFCTCEGHDRERYEVHLACNPNGDWADRARRAADAFHPIASLGTPIRPWADMAALFQIMRLLRREKFDLVHTHTAKAGFLGRVAAWLCRVPVVVHTYHAFPWHNFMSAWKRAAYIAFERCCRPLTDYSITVSENERIEGRKRRVLRWNESETVYSGIDFTKQDRPSDLSALRASLNISEDWLIVLMAGRLDPQKAPELMVEAFAKAMRHHPKTMLLLAGDGELRPLVEAAIREHHLESNVRLLGFRGDVPDLMQLADVFALSSRWEGMGRAMTEAMLLGKPVVVPAINGIPEIVHHSQTGFLYEVGDVEQLAAQLCLALASPSERARIGTNARSLTRRLFDVNHMVEQIERAYERALLKRNPRLIPLLSPASARPAEEPVPLERAA